MMASVAVSIASVAQASDLYQYTGAGNITSGAVISIDGNADSLQAGGIALTDLSNPAGSVITFCLDVSGGLNKIVTGQLYEQVPFSSTTTGLNPPWGTTGVLPDPTGNAAAASAAIQNAATAYYLNGGSLGTDSAKWAALQLAIWEELYDTTVSGANANPGNPLGAGRFQVLSTQIAGVAGTAANEVAGVAANPQPPFPGFVLVPLEMNANGTAKLDVNGNVIPDRDFQEFLVGITPIPEPTTLIAGALLLLPFGASTMRFIRKNRTA